MKKIFTLIAVATMAISAQAQTTISMKGAKASDFSFTQGDFTIGEKEVTINEEKVKIETFTYDKKDKTNYSDLAFGNQLVFQYKNSGQKKDFYQLYPEYFYCNGKGSQIVVKNVKANQVIILKAASKGDTPSKFEAGDNCTADSSNPDDAGDKETDVTKFKEFKFTVTTDGDVMIKETDNGFNLASITITSSTGITSVKAAAQDGAIYNVAGQKVGSDYKGLVIKNGKKFVNK